ncbi:MAG: fumarate hydratase [bacterium]
MRVISAKAITETVKDLCMRAAYDLPADVEESLIGARKREESPAGCEALDCIIENIGIARSEKRPICQDTGIAVFFVEKGAEVCVEDGLITDAINEGVRLGYSEGYLRASIVTSPIDRINTKDNTPAVIHFEEVPGDRLTLCFMAKGGGCENMSRLRMLTPSEGEEGVKDVVVDAMKRAWANPCPPVVIGVGVGGTFEKAAILAKKALFRELGTVNGDARLAAMEKELLERINGLGIGPQGFGGRVTALGVHILSYPCHIASLPVAVNIECHAHRSAKAEM